MGLGLVLHRPPGPAFVSPGALLPLWFFPQSASGGWPRMGIKPGDVYCAFSHMAESLATLFPLEHEERDL